MSGNGQDGCADADPTEMQERLMVNSLHDMLPGYDGTPFTQETIVPEEQGGISAP
ncbi:hypothetical protein DPPLL_22450 [Desulfofustis limnaeus]|uniref:Uncharacterized protein n=1 Tax=Desulfofustis limnaeus TaxID=2740163 RepID=A0ABN6M6N8_9BACT|nr:hypothetical protein DPPLL_22450 [Desulfofustis limnaeus]